MCKVVKSEVSLESTLTRLPKNGDAQTSDIIEIISSVEARISEIIENIAKTVFQTGNVENKLKIAQTITFVV